MSAPTLRDALTAVDERQRHAAAGYGGTDPLGGVLLAAHEDATDVAPDMRLMLSGTDLAADDITEAISAVMPACYLGAVTAGFDAIIAGVLLKGILAGLELARLRVEADR